MAQFASWLKQRYKTVSALNAGWGTSFTSFDLDPINERKGGEAAWILTQEIRDQQLPLNSGTGLTESRSFAPWSEFRTFSDEVFAAAQARCVDIGRSIDRNVRVGFEGGEADTPLSGYDWSRQLREIGSIESYDLANGPEYIRSMRQNKYGQRIFSFITLFDAGAKGSPGTGDRQNRYTIWYRLLHYGVSGAPIWWDQSKMRILSRFVLTRATVADLQSVQTSFATTRSASTSSRRTLAEWRPHSRSSKGAW